MRRTENCCTPRRQSLRAIFTGLSSRCAAIRPNPRRGGICSTLLCKASPMSMLSTLTHVRAPCLQTCCLADFQIRKRPNKGRSADWEVGDTAGLETCVTSSYLRPPALRQKNDLIGKPTAHYAEWSALVYRRSWASE